jgi:hypothetical protein
LPPVLIEKFNMNIGMNWSLYCFAKIVPFFARPFGGYSNSGNLHNF